MSDALDATLAREKTFEPLGENRYLVLGRAYLALVTRGGLGFDIACIGCRASWSHPIAWEELRKIYVAIPAQPSARTIVNRIGHVLKFVLIVGDHICMPRGYAPISRVTLRNVDKHAPRAQQLEAIMCGVAELAAEARRNERGEL